MCARVHVCLRDSTMEAVCLGEYFKLDYVELFSMKEDVWAGKGENTATMSIFT